MVDRVSRIAIHESGHATAARRLQLPAGGASIIEPYAHAKFACDRGAASVVALMAGRAAELIVLGNFDAVGNSIDEELIQERLECCDESADVLWQRTLALVRQNHGAIMWLATHLLYAQQLDGRSIDEAIARS